MCLFRFLLQEIILAHTFSEILSTRRYHSDSGGNFLDMKIGNLMVQKILRIETDQVSWPNQTSFLEMVLYLWKGFKFTNNRFFFSYKGEFSAAVSWVLSKKT